MLFYSDAMTSTTSNVAFGNAYSSVQANTINGSVNIGMLRDRQGPSSSQEEAGR